MRILIPKNLPRKRRNKQPIRGVLALPLLMALALVAASCGSESETVGGESETTAESTAEVASDDGSEATDDSDAADTESDTESDTDSDDAEEAEAADAAGPVSLGDFPAVDVANVVTGESMNLQQELSGGDTPILLWFYAPH